MNNNNHVITRKDNKQVMNGLKQSAVVIPNKGEPSPQPSPFTNGEGVKTNENQPSNKQ